MTAQRVGYYHGLPGSAMELSMTTPTAQRAWNVLAPNTVETFDAFVGDGPPVTLVGFSLGAYSTLQMARLRPAQVASVTLISPAGPLELGDFLPRMAGAPVFRAARFGGPALAALTLGQSAMHRLAPRQLLKAMFAGTCPAETALLQRPEFVAAMQAGLRHSFGPGRAAYHAALRAYVQPWSAGLARVVCPVTIYQGAGDTWAPPDMAAALSDALPNAALHSGPGLGHYSMLIDTLPRVLGPAD